jgi:hypothetical protein
LAQGRGVHPIRAGCQLGCVYRRMLCS